MACLLGSKIVFQSSNDCLYQVLAVEHTRLESRRWDILPASIDLSFKYVRIYTLYCFYAFRILRRDGRERTGAFEGRSSAFRIFRLF